MYLKKYKSALKHIGQHIHRRATSIGENIEAEMPTEEQECLNLIKDQRLYSEALNLFCVSSTSPHKLVKMHSKICVAYADYLLSKKYYEDAALMYESGKDILQAVSAWEKSGNWSYCLALATDAKISATDFVDICRRLIEKLTEEKRHNEAAMILTEHLEDCGEEAVALLADGHCWHDAYRLAAKLGRPDLHETHLTPAIMEAFELTSSSVTTTRTKFDAQVS